MPYIANPLEGLPIRSSFILDQSSLGAAPATDDTLIIYDLSGTQVKQLTVANLFAAPAITGNATAVTQSASNNSTRIATTAYVDAATGALNTVSEMTDVTITSIASGEVLKWNGSAWINQTLAEANILPVAGPTFTGVLTVGSAVLSEADLEQIDDLTAGTAVASKALVVDGNKDIGTLRNLTIDGTFSDGNYTFDTSGNVSGLGTIGSGAITSSGVITGLTIEATGDTAASDNAAIGYTAAEGLILTGQGSTNDITIKNDADATVMSIPTGTTGVTFAGTVGSGAITSTGVVTGTGFTIGSAVINEADLERIDDLSDGVVVASKVVTVSADRHIQTIGNLTIDGVFTDGNYTFDTSGNVTGLGTITGGAITSSGIIKTDSTTNATSITDGSLQTDGGLSVALDVIIGDDVTLISDAAILNFGVNSDVNLTHVHDTGLLLNSSRKIQFGDAGTFIHQSADGVLTIESDTTVDINGAVVFDGALSGITTLGASGIITAGGFTIGSAAIAEAELEMLDGITAGTAAASKAVVLDASKNIATIGTISAGTTTIGSLVVAAASITDTSGAITFGNENLSTTGTLAAGTTTIGTLTVAAASITDSSGAISFGDENLTTSGTISAGNLTVTGTTTTVNSSVMTVVDPIIHLQTASGGGNLSSDTNKDVGLMMEYYSGSAKQAFLGFDDSAAKLTFIPDATLSSEVVSGSVGTIVANLEGTVTASGTINMNTQDIDNIRSATFIAEVDNGNSSTSDTVDWGAGQKQKSTLTGNCTYTFTAPDGPCNLMFKLIQDGTGSRTVTWPNTVKWAGGVAPTLTTTASATDVVAFYFDGTNYYGSAQLAFA